MGYNTSRFFIVHTVYDSKGIINARELACGIFEPSLVSPIMIGIVNQSSGFIVWTSGSNNGWGDDDGHQANIEKLITALAAMEQPPSWCRVDDGDEEGDLTAEHGKDGNWRHVYERVTAEVNPETVTNGNRISNAIEFAIPHATNPDPDVKAWVIDQMVRALTGGLESDPGRNAKTDLYAAVVKESVELGACAWPEGREP